MRRRLILGAAYVLIAVVVGLAVPFGATLSRRLTADLGGRVEREAFAVAAAVEEPIESRAPDRLQALIGRFARDIGGRVLVTDASGVLLADSLQAPGPVPPSYASRPEIAAALRGHPTWRVRHSTTLGYDLLVSAVPIRTTGRTLGAVRISYPMSEVRGAIHRAWWFLAAVGAIALALGLALAAWLARWLSRPVAEAAATARRMASGDLTARVPEAGPPEMAELARDMNDMAERLADVLRANREFAANASHQLRTPLSALRLSLEEIADGADARAEAAHALRQVDRLDGLVRSLLELGELRERSTSEVDARAVADTVALTPRDSTAQVRVAGSGSVPADERRLREILANLVENAGAYARTTVEIRITREPDGAVVIAVEDDGPGIPEDERARVFDRFYRGRRRAGPGSGLGLAVALELARVDGATLRVTESRLGGARFELRYPATGPRGDGSFGRERPAAAPVASR